MQKGRVVSLQYLYFNCSICTISLVVFFFFFGECGKATVGLLHYF